jgi:hypothetical protein
LVPPGRDLRPRIVCGAPPARDGSFAVARRAKDPDTGQRGRTTVLGMALPILRLAVPLAALLAVKLLGRRWMAEWGATAEEVAARLPGDELVEGDDLTTTRAVTVHTGADAVWPWIAQLGQGRGGFYSYDALENLTGGRNRTGRRG